MMRGSWRSVASDAVSVPVAVRAEGEVAGFLLHAGVATKANERAKLERLCRYITRPAVSTKRLSMTRNGRVRYELKTPWRNGTTHVIFEPLDFMFRTNGMPRAQGAQERPFPDWFH